MPIIELRELKKVYHPKKENEVIALNGLSLSVEKGEFLVIRGVSGSGKSTLLHMIGLVDTPTSGEVLLEGNETKHLTDRERARVRNEKIGFVLQDFALIEYRSVFENCCVPLYFSTKKMEGDRKRVISVLKSVGIEKLHNRPVNKLSGGQKQRVAIARALINDPQIILADEPTGQLDSTTKMHICDLFKSIHANGKTVIVVTHDPDFESIASRVIYLNDGSIKKEYIRHETIEAT